MYQYIIKNKKLLITIIVIPLLTLVIFKKHLPDKFKNFVREYILVYSNISNLKLKVEKLEKSKELLKKKSTKKIQ